METINPPNLAKETGGNLATVVTSLSVIDDWDESDRAKVNPIAGQAGVAGNTGTVSALTQRVVLATDVGLPAGTAALGTVGAYMESGYLYIGTTAYEVKRAYLDTASSGSQQVVALVSAKKLRVLSYLISANAAVNVYFRSSTAGQISCTHYLAANGGATGAYNPHGHFETTAGEALQVNLSAAQSIGVRVTYIEV